MSNRNRVWHRISISLTLAALVLGLGSLVPTLAQQECPEPMAPTIEALHHCVVHAVESGHIPNEHLATSLLSKLEAAQAERDRGRRETAANLLNAFIHEVSALGGNQIDAAHAEHMISHAKMVIEAL